MFVAQDPRLGAAQVNGNIQQGSDADRLKVAL